jgi:hypothetical protein
MKTNQKLNLALTLLASGALLYGCGTKQVAQSEVPDQPMANEPSVSQKESFKQAEHYVVKPNDCLWRIAGKPDIYGDPFQWPLLFKANRDLIQDPDLIYPQQKLTVAEGLSQAQIERARQLAMDTPKYKPHPKRTEKQLVEYF